MEGLNFKKLKNHEQYSRLIKATGGSQSPLSEGQTLSKKDPYLQTYLEMIDYKVAQELWERHECQKF